MAGFERYLGTELIGIGNWMRWGEEESKIMSEFLN